MLIYVDIDETICTTEGQTSEARDYSTATPLMKNIQKVNDLYWTARGTTTDIDWREVTEGQFHTWGVKYHELHFKKPAYDLFICDKVINSRRWESEN